MIGDLTLIEQLLIVLILSLFAGFINSLHKQAFSVMEIIENCIIAVFSGIICFLFSLELTITLVKKLALAGLGALVGESIIYAIRKKFDLIIKAITK